ncbi:hypothetical protein HNQ74_000003 [Bartonella doshiae]|uniref:Uncharacterized protein n=2 Tax=Bartonella doshiae TaxID=33044 RepID=A0A380ZGW8_BARDO|nr:hypothetical protein MCS_00943 [Bartonella doshiae NCTC 12862 = ATCC 700133]MBB6158597.1 hypothetical protein [Bartonella doshiae]SUV46213.1 Uncharacterised protein [Bartonella doshiae]
MAKQITNLYRIKALKDFDDVKAGILGGFIEKEVNLSHDGNCWVYDDAWVYGHAQVSGCACVYSHVKIYNYAVVNSCAKIYGKFMAMPRSHIIQRSGVELMARQN